MIDLYYTKCDAWGNEAFKYVMSDGFVVVCIVNQFAHKSLAGLDSSDTVIDPKRVQS